MLGYNNWSMFFVSALLHFTKLNKRSFLLLIKNLACTVKKINAHPSDMMEETAAPLIPILGKPKLPKIRLKSKKIFTITMMMME